jgi:hypothetical protein
MPLDDLETAEELTRAETVDAVASGTGEVLIAIRNEPANWLFDGEERLKQMAQLEPNWDSYGAAPVDAVAIHYAQLFMRQAAMVQGIEPPSITATPNGRVGLSWDDEHRTMDVEIDSHGRFTYFYQRGDTELEAVTVDRNDIIERLSRV